MQRERCSPVGQYIFSFASSSCGFTHKTLNVRNTVMNDGPGRNALKRKFTFPEMKTKVF